MKIFKYQIDQLHDTHIWVCNPCKKDNWEKILLKQWKLIDSDDADRHQCGLCMQRKDAAEPHDIAPATRAA